MTPFTNFVLDEFNGVSRLALINRASFGAESTLAGDGNITGAESPEGEERFYGYNNCPGKNYYDDNAEDFNEGTEGLYPGRMLESDFFQDCVLDIVLEVSVTFLQSDLFAKAIPSLLK